MRSIRNIGIIAHVDAGKTTITEQMLYLTGELRKPGSVDNGTSVMDNLSVEKDRGITVKAAAIQFAYENALINLIDTPGHADFIGEVERSLSGLDGAIIVLSAAEGIEAQTPLLWHFLQLLKIPAIIFINKIDRMNSDVEKVIENINQELTDRIIVMQKPVLEAKPEASIESWQTDNTETICEQDDELIMKYLEGIEISDAELDNSLKKSCQAGKLYPVLMGAAKNGVGIKKLLDGIVNYLPEPEIFEKTTKFSGRIFKISFHPTLGKLCYIRVFNGNLKPRDILFNATRDVEEKVNAVFVSKTRSPQMTDELQAGEVGIVTGLKTSQTGDYLGVLPSEITPELTVSPFMVQINAENPSYYSALAEALAILNIEEPNLDFNWDKEERHLSLKVMGYIHIQILEQTIKDRFNIDAKLSDPEIIYKETPLRIAEGYDEYTMPKPCWAIVRFKIMPGARGSGVVYNSIVSVDKIAVKYQKEVRRAIHGALDQGILGWEVTDIIITLTYGEDHEIHSRPGNFAIATNIALMKALEKSKTTLLEPILSISITIAEELSGKIMSDILMMRGSYEPPVSKNGYAMIKGKVPAATSADYQIALSSISGGKSAFQTSFYGYEACDIDLGRTRSYKGVNPLDRAKYILKMRGAVTEGKI
ncbi:MAG: TetM/TetW/TetO/TetS family tetracycline resistance ribosomal protection protein [Candidatus Stygibacter australis]|nr:TetM/TetW/TetO/TetS family tetracycline resistance ribosomal protection protein [Candidatus Stygibacter australis]